MLVKMDNERALEAMRKENYCLCDLSVIELGNADAHKAAMGRRTKKKMIQR